MVLFSGGAWAQKAAELNQKAKDLLQHNQIEEALPFLKKAANLGSPEAQYSLGYCFQNGFGVEKNMKTAVTWYKKSSDQGFNDGHFAMMMAYAQGNGVLKSDEKAFEYALKCANNNDATCMFNVVNCYKTGLGTLKDNVKMLEWATRLGVLENPDNLQLSGSITSMRLLLAHMYRDGGDVEKNNATSYLWYLIYNEFKKDLSAGKQEGIINEINAIEKNLDRAQIENAQKEAEKILKRPLRNLANLHKVDYP